MTSKQLIAKILGRLNKVKLLILLGGIIIGALLFFTAKNKVPEYTYRSSLYPLASSADNSSGQSKLSELIGGGSGAKSLSDEANVNIEEVARSKKTRAAVVAERLPEFGNKTIAAILVEDYNKYKSFLTPTLEMPTNNDELISTGADLLSANYSVKFNKLNLLEIYLTSSNSKLLVPVSVILIDKISQFYKELKIKKAQFDYNFVQQKVDSLELLLQQFDQKRIYLNNTTLFVPQGKLQYSVPKENLERNRLLVLAQRNGAASNREEALWRLQKVTPIIEILDKPALFNTARPSKMIYGIGGFVLGLVLFTILSIAGILYKYLKAEVNKKLAEVVTDPISPVSSTAATI